MSSRKEVFNIDCEHCEVRHMSMFGVLCEHERADLNVKKMCKTYAKGQLLFHQGSRPLGVYCINKGKVKVYSVGYQGKEQIVNISTPGQLLGYRTMIGEETYNVNAEALEDTNVCFVPKSDFLNLVQHNHELYNNLFKAACKELGVMAESITNLAQKTVRERTAITLLMLKDTYGLDGIEDGPVVINLSRQDLANIVGTATEALIRQLHDFKEEGLIESEGRKIKVINPQGLVKVGNL
jgi:CRP-like cAMP-binding protein